MAKDIGEAVTTRRDAVGHGGTVVGAGVPATRLGGTRPVSGTDTGLEPATPDVSPDGFDGTEPFDRGTLADAFDRGTLADVVNGGAA